jgi:pyrroline-5-carboxylate reductase
MKIAFLGAGVMAEALIKAVVDSGAEEEIIATNIQKERLEELKQKYDIEVTEDNSKACKADVIFLCVRPQDMNGLLEEIKQEISDKLIVSIAAGLKIEFFEEKLGSVPIIRTMPNPFASVHGGCIAYCYNENVKPEHIETVKKLMSPLCKKMIELEEKNMDAFTALGASICALVYKFVRGLEKGAEKVDFPKDVAHEVIINSITASLETAEQSKLPLQELIDEACTPGGVTIEGVKVLDENKFEEVIADAVKAITEKGEELSKK